MVSGGSATLVQSPSHRHAVTPRERRWTGWGRWTVGSSGQCQSRLERRRECRREAQRRCRETRRSRRSVAKAEPGHSALTALTRSPSTSRTCRPIGAMAWREADPRQAASAKPDSQAFRLHGANLYSNCCAAVSDNISWLTSPPTVQPSEPSCARTAFPHHALGFSSPDPSPPLRPTALAWRERGSEIPVPSGNYAAGIPACSPVQVLITHRRRPRPCNRSPIWLVTITT